MVWAFLGSFPRPCMQDWNKNCGARWLDSWQPRCHQLPLYSLLRSTKLSMKYQLRRKFPAVGGLASAKALIISFIARGPSLCANASMIDERQLTWNPLMAAYNSTWGAPACLELGSSCQTDDDMIAGVGSFEPNFPNSVDDCVDSSWAVQGQDEYINRIIIRSKDSETMAAGKELQIHATVALAQNVSSRLKADVKEIAHIYYASETFGKSLHHHNLELWPCPFRLYCLTTLCFPLSRFTPRWCSHQPSPSRNALEACMHQYSGPRTRYVRGFLVRLYDTRRKP